MLDSEFFRCQLVFVRVMTDFPELIMVRNTVMEIAAKIPIITYTSIILEDVFL